MRLAIIAAGSRGDIQPYLALGTGLQAAGHDVRFAANVNFEELVATYGLTFFPLAVDSQSFVQGKQGRAWLDTRSPLHLALHSYRAVRPTVEPLLRGAWHACQGVDALIYHTFTLPFGYYIGKELGLPTLPASMYPLPTRAHPALSITFPAGLGGWANLAGHLLVDQFAWLVYHGPAKAFWKGRLPITLRSPYHHIRAERRPVVCCYSPSVLPVPSDLPDQFHVTGYWFLPPPPGWQPDAALARFLDAGPPPVYVGFGSMGNPAAAAETTKLVLDALARTGQRAVLASGWSGLGEGAELPGTVHLLQGAPHTWLFPRMAAIVHHGGVGTTGAGLYAGVPNVVVPHFADQFFWGRRVAALGAGPAPLPRPTLTAERLAEALERAVDDEALRRRAAALSERIQSEDGIGRAIAHFESFVAARQD